MESYQEDYQQIANALTSNFSPMPDISSSSPPQIASVSTYQSLPSINPVQNNMFPGLHITYDNQHIQNQLEWNSYSDFQRGQQLYQPQIAHQRHHMEQYNPQAYSNQQYTAQHYQLSDQTNMQLNSNSSYYQPQQFQQEVAGQSSGIKIETIKEEPQLQMESDINQTPEDKTEAVKSKPDNSSKKRIRTVFTAKQISTLESQFNHNMFSTTLVRKQLSEDLNLPMGQIKTWYQNRRMKFKRVNLAIIEAVKQNKMAHEEGIKAEENLKKLKNASRKVKSTSSKVSSPPHVLDQASNESVPYLMDALNGAVPSDAVSIDTQECFPTPDERQVDYYSGGGSSYDTAQSIPHSSSQHHIPGYHSNSNMIILGTECYVDDGTLSFLDLMDTL